MIYFENNKWHISDNKILYRCYDEEVEEYVGIGGVGWWRTCEDKWAHIKIIEFKDVNPTKEQLSRLDIVNKLGLRDGTRGVAEYVEHNRFPNDIKHPLNIIRLMDENKRQGQEITDRYISEILQGQQISDLEIEVLKLGGYI